MTKKQYISPARLGALSLLALGGVSSSINAQASCCKEVLYVNMQDSMVKSKAGQQAQKVFEKKQEEYTQWAQDAQQNLVKKKQEIDAQAGMLSADAKRKKEKEFERWQRDAQDKDQEWKYEMQTVMQQESEKMDKILIDAAPKVTKKVGKELPIVDATTGRVLYLPKEYDNTDMLVSVLDEEYTIKLAESKNVKKTAAA